MICMNVLQIKTRICTPPKDDLFALMKESLDHIKEKSIIAITSKVVSIWRGRCVPKDAYPSKDDLIKYEADKYLPRDAVPNRWTMHTIKHHLLMPAAGIDESNANGFYVLLPKNPKEDAKEICQRSKVQYRVREMGVLITDSRTLPLRRGVTGVALGYFGFSPLNDYRGKEDLFGEQLLLTQTNVADALAACAVLVMGEGSESTPIAVIDDVSFVVFGESQAPSDKPFASLEVEESEDLYYPFLSSVQWEKGGGGT